MNRKKQITQLLGVVGALVLAIALLVQTVRIQLFEEELAAIQTTMTAEYSATTAAPTSSIPQSIPNPTTPTPFYQAFVECRVTVKDEARAPLAWRELGDGEVEVVNISREEIQVVSRRSAQLAGRPETRVNHDGYWLLIAEGPARGARIHSNNVNISEDCLAQLSWG